MSGLAREMTYQELSEAYTQRLRERDQYKQAYQHCVDDLIVLRANNKRLERQNAEQLALLKQFRKLIDYKLTLHQGSSMYREYRSKLDELGVK
ncbi:hypothetical protein [Staphylococcus sp. GDY8P31P]|uniref:hypothetical protein n=1 Tax=Staphylococcus sp. GDY8P31P TaxID=2804115 RepID=UPI001AEBFF46|nr:hypothetical protein [Staphylococcus sp. GDY8P31P]